MEDLFGHIECRTNSDSIVMRILRSAMDEAHEKLQSRAGPIQFLHDRSTFYELAAILVDGGLSIIHEQATDILQDNSNKILSDLTEIKGWLSGRIVDMKQLIVEKDTELSERLENELQLQQALDLKDQEISYLHEKLEPGRAKNEDIVKLKSSVDQQVSNIKQKLEDETKILSIERRNRKTRLSSPNLSFDFLDKERNGSPIFREDGDILFDVVKPNINNNSNNNQNVLIRKMSSDIDVLKETLDLAFGRMQCVETIFPLEKQWRCGVERDVESVLIRGFVDDLNRGFFDDWFEIIDEMRSLCYEMTDILTVNDVVHETRSMRQRSSSEPLSVDISFADDVDEKNHVAKMKKNFESIIRKQVEDVNLPTRSCYRVGKEKENNGLERRIRDAIVRLDNFTKRDQEKSRISRNYSNKVEGSEIEIEKLKDERDGLCFRISVMEDTYRILLLGIAKDICSTANEMNSDDNVNGAKECDDEIGRLLKKDIYMVVFREMVQAWKSENDAYALKCLVSKDNSSAVCDKSPDDNINSAKECDDDDDDDNIESLLKEDMYMVYFREMIKAWNSRKDAYVLECLVREDTDDNIESLLKEDIYMVVFREMVQAWKLENDAYALECLVSKDNSSAACYKSPDDNINSAKECVIDDEKIKSLLKEDMYMVYFREMIKAWNSRKDAYILECLTGEDTDDKIESLLKEDIYMVFTREMVSAWKSANDDCSLECLMREDIYEFVIIEAAKDSHVLLSKSEELKQLDFAERTPRSRKSETDGNRLSLLEKLDSFKKCLETEEDLMLSANSEINGHNVNNSLVISTCEEIDERNAIKWLITDDESTFCSVSEKLERALQQVYTSKELLMDLEENYLESQLNDDASSIDHEKVRLEFPCDNVILACVMQYQRMVANFEHVLQENLQRKSLRLEILKREVDAVIKPVALIRKRKLLYKNAFLSRCHNLKLAEIEVDLLGDQVESLLCLLQKLYLELNQNAILLSGHFKVYDFLKLIEGELNDGRDCFKPRS